MRISIYALCVAIIIINLIIVAVGQACYKINPYIFDSGLPGMTVLIIAGVHGNERSGTKALMDLIHKDDIIITRGRLIIIPYANWCGWLTGRRTVPTKGINKDLNRHFMVDHATGLAKDILFYVKQADFVLDLHESNNYYENGLGEDMYNGRTMWSNKGRIINEKVKININKVIHQGPPFILDIGAASNIESESMLMAYCLYYDIPYLLVETCRKDSLEERVLHNKIAINSIVQNINSPP